MSGERRPREVVSSPEFQAQARRIESNVRRFDELFRGIEWALARSQREGPVVLTADLGSQGRKVQVTATVEATKVTLTGISMSPEEE